MLPPLDRPSPPQDGPQGSTVIVGGYQHMVQQGERQSFPFGYHMGRISRASSVHIRAHASAGQIMDAVAVPFDLPNVGLAGIGAGHAPSQDRGCRAGIGEVHALQGVHAGTKQFRQLNLNLVEGSPSRTAGRLLGHGIYYGGICRAVNEGEVALFEQVQVPVAIYVLKGGTCRTRYCRGVRAGKAEVRVSPPGRTWQARSNMATDWGVRWQYSVSMRWEKGCVGAT